MKTFLIGVVLLSALAPQAWCRDTAGLKALDKAVRKAVAPLASKLNGKVCVLDFSELADSSYTSEFGQKVAELASNHLVNKKGRLYQVMERRELIKIMRDSIMMVGDDAAAVASLQKQGGMDVLVSGTYSASGGEVSVDLKAVDAKTGSLIGSSSMRLKRVEGLDKMIGHRFRGSAPSDEAAKTWAAESKPTENAHPEVDILELEAGVFYEGGDGKLYPLREGMVLNSKDNYAVYVKPRQPCYVYIYQVDSTKKATRLFPNDRFTSVSGPLTTGKEYWVPEGRDYLYLDETQGLEDIYVFATRAPSSALESIKEAETDSLKTVIRTMGVAGRRGGEAPVRARGTRGEAMDLVTRKLAAQGDFFYKVSFVHR